MKNTIKKELIKAVSDRSGEAIVTVTGILNVFFEYVKEQGEQNNNVVLRGFGTFYPHLTPEKKGQNMKTREVVIIEPRKTVKFRPAQEFKDRLKCTL
jgi:nucleoid DNA-binding protein